MGREGNGIAIISRGFGYRGLTLRAVGAWNDFQHAIRYRELSSPATENRIHMSCHLPFGVGIFISGLS